MKVLVFFVLVATSMAASASDQAPQLEALYFESLESLFEFSENPSDENQRRVEEVFSDRHLSLREQNVVLKSFFDWSLETEKEKIFTVLDFIKSHKRPLHQHILLYSLKQRLNDSPVVIDDWMLESRIDSMLSNNMNEADLFQLCYVVKKYPEDFDWLTRADSRIGEACKILNEQLAIKPPTTSQLRDLVKKAPDVRELRRGRYHLKPRLYQFCRTDRNYHCQLLMMDAEKKWVKNSSGEIWSKPVLSLSRRGLAFNEFGGDTPAGVYTIDGVMPEANKQHIYGRWRRLIIEFIEKAESERYIHMTLPSSNSVATWWRESVIARDMGRDLLRVHGTLRRNLNPTSTFYPFYPTLGCVATRETEYDGIDYRDQRILLDQLMQTQGLPVRYSSETQIKGLLYVIEIDSRNRHVTMGDLDRLGLL